jgi:hypothetical protein
MRETLLRSYIQLVLEMKDKDDNEKKKSKKVKNLLVEPDETKERNDADTETEVSAGGVAGVSVPLGAGPHYPAPDSPAVKRIKKQIDVVGRAFGNAKPNKKRKK